MELASMFLLGFFAGLGLAALIALQMWALRDVERQIAELEKTDPEAAKKLRDAMIAAWTNYPRW